MENSQETLTPKKTKKPSNPGYLYPLVELQWLDAVTHNGWLDLDELQKENSPSHTITVAFLVKEDDKALYLASTYHDVETNAQITVPKGMVLSLKILKKAKLRGKK